MPIEGPLPQTGDAQEIGADAGRCFGARIPRNWRPHPLEGTDDYGLDYQIQTTPNQQATDIFRVQLKGTRSPKFSADGAFLSITLKASTVRYYDRIVEPILLVVCDLSANDDPVDCPLYYVWVRNELSRISIEELAPEQSYVTFRVPVENRLRSSTDLTKDIDSQNELARAGHALGATVGRIHSKMLIEEQVGFVQRMTTGIEQRSPALMDALAAPVNNHWPEPAAGSLAWHLKEAKINLNSGLLDRAEQELESANQLLPGIELETAEYWFLLGRLQAAKGWDRQASASFKNAYETSWSGKYVSAYVESELRVRFRDDMPHQPFPDLLEVLQGDDSTVLAARSRILAAEGKFIEAIEVADKISGWERYTARALAFTMFGKSEEAIADCEVGLVAADLPANTRQIFLVLRARSKFALCQIGSSLDEGQLIPPGGSAGMDGALVKAAWAAIEEALTALRDSGWGNNVDLIADIWAATASILAKQRVILPELTRVAKLRPHCQNLQFALEAIAAQCGEFSTALEANDRLPMTDMKILRRTLSLHENRQHTDCYRWFDQYFDKLDRKHVLFGAALTVAAISAHKLVKPELVKKWAAELDAHSHLAEHAALLNYSIAKELNAIDNDVALERLLSRYQELDRPFFLSIVLLQELNPTDERQAGLCVQISQRIRETAEPSPGLAIQVGLAMVTLKSWEQLLKWCEAFKTRIDAWPKMQAFEALALDRLGRTPEARVLLERMLAGGVQDAWALNTYMIIMARCGYVDEAIDAAEKMMESASNVRQKIECTRLLFILIQQVDPGSERLLALALQMGRLACPDTEIEEGRYLAMYVTATLVERVKPEISDIAEFERRAQKFFEKFPNSNIIKQAQFRDDATGYEILAQIKKIAGITEDREIFQRKLENQMQRGQTAVPFAWRPGLILTSIRDVVHLWEVAKDSSVDDKKYHLTMLTNTEWTPRSVISMRERTPLLDMTALLIIFDLGLLDAVVSFFGRIAIAKSTLELLAGFVNPFSGSFARSKCVALQNKLKEHLGAIMQPSVGDVLEGRSGAGSLGDQDDDQLYSKDHREIIRLCQQDDSYRLYSDDLALRILTARSDNPDGLCTLELLYGLCEVGAISQKNLAEKIASLCGWRVGLVVPIDVIFNLMPSGLSSTSSARDGMLKLDCELSLKAVLDAVWDFRAPFQKTLEHAAAVARAMADRQEFSGEMISAFIGQWFVKASLKEDAPKNARDVLVKVIVFSAMSDGLVDQAAKKLWKAYIMLIEFLYGDLMDEQKEAEAIGFLGRECAMVWEHNSKISQNLKKSLLGGLTSGTSDEEHFQRGFTETLQQLAISSNRADR